MRRLRKTSLQTSGGITAPHVNDNHNNKISSNSSSSSSKKSASSSSSGNGGQASLASVHIVRPTVASSVAQVSANSSGGAGVRFKPNNKNNDMENGGGGGGGSGGPIMLTADVYKNFEKTGRSEFLRYIKQQLKDSNGPIFDRNNEFKASIAGAIYDLLWHAIRSTIKKDLVISVLTDVVTLHDDFHSMILDIVNVLDAETSLTADAMQDERSLFLQLMKDLARVVPEKLIKERLEIDTLQEVGIVKQKMFYTKFIKIKTKLYYKQRRFNLFREESEGYAKLITELNVDFEEDVTAESFMDIIKSLIGCFNLDPNRVLDIIIESFEMRPECWQMFIPLLRSYMPTSSIICEVLGYKFRYYADTRTPKSLYHVCALLLKYGVIELNDIYVWLNPTDRNIAQEWELQLAEAKEYVRKLNVIITNKDKEPAEPEPEREYTEEQFNANQKFGLCESLLKVGDWHNASNIIRKLPEQCVLVHESIAHALCQLVHLSIEHVYTSRCFKAPETAARSSRVRSKLYDDVKVLQKLQAREFNELRQAAFPMVTVLGPSLHYDSVLMFKLVRILRTILSEMGVNTLNAPTPHTDSETLYYEVMSILDAAILPALSYMDSNCPMSEEIMTVLKYYPYHFRYSLYARWKNDSYLIHPKLIRRRGNAQKSIKALMKRVSKENVKPVGRHMGKLSHCAPGFLFDYILLQIQIYDNLIGPVVDSFKYLTSLSFDCLSYCLIEALAMADRNRIKHDGMSISLWLQSLANFCGAIYKKYNIELSGLLQFVANQLKMQKSLDLLILKEIVQKMAGVESAEEMTNEQLNAMCGGELLRGEAGYFSQVRNTKKSSQRLKDALAYNDLAVTICLLMAQQKHCVIYRETAQSHLKLVGKLYDQCQDTLVQFGTFLGSSYSVDEYVDRLPSIITMLQDYHINADVAFFLARPMFSHQINIKYDQLRKADPNAKKLTTLQKQAKYLEAINYVMNPIIESVRPLHGPKVWEDISPQFLVTFWSLSMYDLQVPSESYQKEVSKLKLLSQQAIESKDSNASKNKKEQERFLALMEKLQDERKKQQEHVDKTLQRLQHQKDNWFLSRSAKSAKNETITQFLQLCLFPRCTFTALDALYCAKFVHSIHNLKANNFSTLLCYDRIFCDITYSVTSCTENEATRYGRFLCALLETVMRWHSDQSIFNRECANYPGFVTKFRVSNQFSEANDHVGYENYRHVCHKWHYKITKAIVFCLDSKEYMQIRNALIILMRILPYYPVLVKLANIIERKVEKVREEEKHKRPDLFVIASSYIGQLKTRAAQMINENDFHQVYERTPRADSTSSSAANTSNGAATGTTTASATIQLAAGASASATTSASTGSNTTPLNNVNNNATTTATKASTSTTSPTVAALTAITSTSSTSAAAAVTTTVPTSSTSTYQQTTSSNSTQSQSSTLTNTNNIGQTTTSVSTKVSNGDLKAEKRDKERSEKSKIIKLTSGSTNSSSSNEKDILASNDTANNNNNNNSSSLINNSSSTRSNNIMELRDELTAAVNEREQRERDRERERFPNTRSSLKELSKKEREREREQRYHRSEETLESSQGGSLSGNFTPTRKREKRREERFRAESPPEIDILDNVMIDKHAEYEREQRGRDRDLSSVSNESNGSMQRRSQEVLEYEKDSKRRKMEQASTSKKQLIPDELLENVKKDRGAKNKERKEKMTDEERETRKERKLGRKRERLEESSLAEHKRRREVLNGEEDVRDRSDKYHPRESPHMREVRERSHEKFDRSDRSTRGGGGDDRTYGPAKLTRSRINY